MEVEQHDSYFRFVLQSHLFAKKTSGIWGTCTLCSRQPRLHTVKCDSTAGDGFVFGFLLSGRVKAVYFMQTHRNWSRLESGETSLCCRGAVPWKCFSVFGAIQSVKLRIFSMFSISFLVGMHWRVPLSISLLLTSTGEGVHYISSVCLPPKRLLK